MIVLILILPSDLLNFQICFSPKLSVVKPRGVLVLAVVNYSDAAFRNVWIVDIDQLLLILQERL